METNKLNTPDTIEANLLKIIQRQLPPVEQERLDYLISKNEVNELIEAEQKEFLVYADRIESQGVDKIEALVELAQLRNVEPRTLLDEFFPEQ